MTPSDRPETPGRRGDLPSLLGPWLRAILYAVLGLAALVFADSLYLVAVRLLELAGLDVGGAGAASSLFFQTALLGHSILGTLLVLLVGGFVVLHLPSVWRRRHAASLASGAVALTLCGVLLLTGLFVLTEAASRGNRWAWWLHVGGALALPLAYAAHRRASYARPRSGVTRGFARALAALVLAFGIGHVLAGQVRPPEVSAVGPPPEARNLALERLGAVPPGYASPTSPYYPSPATTSTGSHAPAAAVLGPLPPDERAVADGVASRGFYAETGIGAESCVRCHPDVTAQWETSAHRFSSFNNPFYEASIVRLRAGTVEANPWLAAHRAATGVEGADGALKSRWCGACHDPALLYPGGLDREVNRASVEAQAGLTCLGCHAIERLHDRTGNGNVVFRSESPELYVFGDEPGPGLKRDLHDAALRARPEAHRAAMLSDVLRSAEGCAACHKVSLREPLNDYRWLRGQNEFDNWENSGVSREGAQTFYLPPERRICQDCHMPPEDAPLGDLAAVDGTVRSHRFTAANTALPFLRGDTATLRRVEEFLRDEIVSIDVFGWRSESGDRVERALGPEFAVPPGADVLIDVVVRNRGTGHTFPGGTLDSNEGWLDVRLVDEQGTLVARSGALDSEGHLDPEAHVYRALFVDSAGREIDRRNPQDIRALVFVNAIGPGTANLAHYRLAVPSTPGRYALEVRLQWRKFNRPYSEFVYETVPQAFPGHERAPSLPVTTVARADAVLLVGGEDRVAGGLQDAGEARDAGAWLRWNDFGIASIREGTTRAAREAFTRVDELRPEAPDGPMNLARVALDEGDVYAALDLLDEAERRAPDDARLGWLRGEAHLAEGAYPAAAASYRRALAAFPRHRASLLGVARALYLDGRYEEALPPLDALLDIDPEARPAWYHRMLVLRSLDQTAEAARAEAMVEYLRVDDSAGRLTREIRAERPGVNAMAQDVRTHPLRPADP